MNPIFNKSVIRKEIFHQQFNLDKKHNLNDLPETRCVFGVFGIIHNTPVHPRFVGSTTNLRKSVLELYENPPGAGMKKFMQGPWIQMICYQELPDLSDEQLKAREQAWIQEYRPGVKDDGEYPEYTYEWIYNEDGSLKPEYANPPAARV